MASSTEQDGVRRPRVHLFEHAHDLFQLPISTLLSLGGRRIDDQHVGALRLGGRERVERDAAESAPCSRAITGAPWRSPQISAVDRRRAERITAASMTRRPSLRNFAAIFPIVVVLPEPLTQPRE